MKRFRPLLFALACLSAAALPAAETPVNLGDGDRVLVVSAHPGDAILACAGLLQEARDLDLPVQVVCLTSGESDEFFAYFVPGRKPRPSPLSYQLRETSERRSCVLDAAEELGLGDDAYVFLGYPAGGLATLWREVWRDAPGWVSPRERAATPAFDVRTPSAPFTAKALLTDLEGALRDFAPTHVFAPSPLEASDDHRAAASFVRAALLDLAGEGLSPRLHSFFVHAADWPVARAADAEGPLSPPEGEADWLAEGETGDIATLRLAPYQRERAAKARAALALPADELAARFAASDERFPAAADAAALPVAAGAFGETRYGVGDAFLSLAGADKEDLDARDEARALVERTGNAFLALEAADAGDAVLVTLRLARPLAPGVETRLFAYAVRQGVPFAETEKDAFSSLDADDPADPRTVSFRLEKRPGETHRLVSAELVDSHGLPLDDFPPLVLATGIPAAPAAVPAAEAEEPAAAGNDGEAFAPPAVPEAPPEAPEPPKEVEKPAKKAKKKAAKATPRETSAADRPMLW